MADFNLWGRIEQIRTDLFYVIVAALPCTKSNPEDAMVRTGDAPSRQQAEALRDRLMREVGEQVRQGGDRVVDIETDL